MSLRTVWLNATTMQTTPLLTYQNYFPRCLEKRSGKLYIKCLSLHTSLTLAWLDRH